MMLVNHGLDENSAVPEDGFPIFNDASFVRLHYRSLVTLLVLYTRVSLGNLYFTPAGDLRFATAPFLQRDIPALYGRASLHPDNLGSLS